MTSDQPINGVNPAGAESTAREGEPAAAAPVSPTVQTVQPGDPKQWLAAGWRDMKRSRFLGMFYGFIFVLMGYAISLVYQTKWQLTMGLIGGFFLVGPFLATGIYDLSRQLERGESPSLLRSLVCWRRNPSAIAFFSLMLTFSMIVWARVSLIIFALFSTTEFPTLKRVLATVFSFENLPFLGIWTLVGLFFATVVFAISVVSAPMILDRESDAISAIFASVRCLFVSPGPLVLWALMIVVIIGASLMLGYIPLLITAPLIGHATWHAYRHCLSFETR